MLVCLICYCCRNFKFYNILETSIILHFETMAVLFPANEIKKEVKEQLAYRAFKVMVFCETFGKSISFFFLRVMVNALFWCDELFS